MGLFEKFFKKNSMDMDDIQKQAENMIEDCEKMAKVVACMLVGFDEVDSVEEKKQILLDSRTRIDKYFMKEAKNAGIAYKKLNGNQHWNAIATRREVNKGNRDDYERILDMYWVSLEKELKLLL